MDTTAGPHLIPYMTDDDQLATVAVRTKAQAERVHARLPRAGTFNVPSGVAGALDAYVVSFGYTFATTPCVSVNAIVADPAQYPVTAITATTTGFTLKIKRTGGGGAIPVTWIAVPT